MQSLMQMRKNVNNDVSMNPPLLSTFCHFRISVHCCFFFILSSIAQGCKDYWSDLFIEWRTDAHLIQRCRQRISILQLPLYWNHGHCQEQNVLLHSLLGVSFTHIKGITSSKEIHYHLIYAELGSLFSPRFTCSCTLLTVGLIAWQPFYTPACFNCIIRSNVVILDAMKRHTCKIWLLIKKKNWRWWKLPSKHVLKSIVLF